MRLTNDLIRDTLLCIEKECTYYTDPSINKFLQSRINWETICENKSLAKKYSSDDIKYCILKLREAGMIETYSPAPDKSSKISYITIKDITWQGHEFLNNIRDDSVWEYAKSKLGDISKISFSALVNIVSEFVVAYGKQKLGL